MDQSRQHGNQAAGGTRRFRAAAPGRVLVVRLLVGVLLLVGAVLAGRQVVRHFKEGSASEEALAVNDRGVASFKKGEVDKAIADFTEAIRLNPKAVSAYVNRALAADTKGQLELALADCNTAIQLDPKLAVLTLCGASPGKERANTTKRSPIATRRSASIPSRPTRSSPVPPHG